MRTLVAVVVAGLAAAFGGAIVGEYELRGVGAIAAAALFGVVLAEIVSAIAREHGWPQAAVAAVATAGGLLLARSIQWRFRSVPVEVTLGIVLGAVVAAGWLRSSRGRGRDSRSA